MKSMLSILIILMSSLNIFSQNKVETFIKEGVELNDAGKLDNAIAKFEEALKLEPKNFTAHYEIASTLLAKKDLKQAMKHAEIASSGKGTIAGLAFTLIGNMQDMDGKSKDAIKSFKSALKFTPNDYNIYYNLGITHHNLKQPKEAEEALFEAIKLKPNHASSHFALGVIAYNNDKKTKALLALYQFLMYETKSTRSKNAFKIIKTITDKSAEKTDSGFNITLNSNDNDDFSAADLLLSMSKIVDDSAEQKLKDSLGTSFKSTDVERFCKTNDMIFSFFDESKEKEKEKTNWWKFYGKFYGELSKKGFSEPFSYFISQSTQEKEVKEWLSKNDAKVKNMVAWINEYSFKF
jgi:tetratricopeptide (TPR) repeat protein